VSAAPPLLQFDDLTLEIDTFDGALQVLDGVSLTLGAGETLGLVGETGCGKSVTAKSMLRLLPMPPARVVRGDIRFEGRSLVAMPERAIRRLRGVEIAMIFQDPMTFLNPVFSVGQQMVDAILAQNQARAPADRLSRRAALAHAIRMLGRVHLPNPELAIDAYPHALSGGQRQRVLIAMALSGSPKLLIADEPTTALDVTIQAQILALMGELVRDLGLAVLMISHDLGVVARVCQRIAVMYAGCIVEEAPTAELLAAPRHPYTQGLLAAIPHLHRPAQKLERIKGTIPDLLVPPPGCRFHPRCPHAFRPCDKEKPPDFWPGAGHRAACHLLDEARAA
jgi:oligopeptide/dipeptide ABC transporter ATP-binding protein